MNIIRLLKIVNIDKMVLCGAFFNEVLKKLYQLSLILLANLFVITYIFSQDDSSQKWLRQSDSLYPRIISIDTSMKFRISIDTLKLLDSSILGNLYKGRITITNIEDDKKKIVYNTNFSLIYGVYHYQNYIYIHYSQKTKKSKDVILKIDMKKLSKYLISDNNSSISIIGIDSVCIYLKFNRARPILNSDYQSYYQMYHSKKKLEQVLLNMRKEIIFYNKLLIVETLSPAMFGYERLTISINSENKRELLSLEEKESSYNNVIFTRIYFNEYLAFYSNDVIYLVNHKKIDDIKYVDRHTIEKIILLKNNEDYNLTSINIKGNKIYFDISIYKNNRNTKYGKISLDISNLKIKKQSFLK